MRVVLDARPALDPIGTGVTHYTRRIVEHLPRADPSSDFVAWYLHARGLFRSRTFFDDAGPNLVERPSRFPARIFQPLSWRIGFPRVDRLVGGFDLFVATNFLPPPTGSPGKIVQVVHDLAFDAFPETAPHIDPRWRRRFRSMLEEAAGAIVPSAAVADDLVAGYPIGMDRVHVVHHGVDPFEPSTPDEVRRVPAALGIEGRSVLFVGGIEKRKNIVNLVRAFGRAVEPATLVIAGGAVRWDPRAGADVDAAISALPKGRRVVRAGRVSERDKRALLSVASVLAYPSLAEGFGFPVLEGFAAGVPVLTSNVSSLPEVAGGAALLVDPSDPDAIAEGLDRLLSDEALRPALVRAGRERVALFTWDACARGTADVLHRAAEGAR